MKLSELVNLFKYYQEEDCPFEHKSNEALWWGGEKVLYDLCYTDKDYFQILVKDLKKDIKHGVCHGILINEYIPIEKRAIVYFLNMWHLKWFPYDNHDVIFNY